MRVCLQVEKRFFLARGAGASNHTRESILLDDATKEEEEENLFFFYFFYPLHSVPFFLIPLPRVTPHPLGL